MIAGIDVGKYQLDAGFSNGKLQRVTNDDKGIAQLLDWLQRQGVSGAVCEPTGGYERALVQAFAATDITVSVAHANRVRAFAKAQGYLAKTDRIDALVLARFGEVFGLSPKPPVMSNTLKLQGLLRRRQQLVGMRTQELNRLEKPVDALTKESLRSHIDWINDTLIHLEQSYQELLKQSDEHREAMMLYTSVKGIGSLSAATLIAELPELGHVGSKQIASLAGLAPWSHDSGKKRGYRAIRGGRTVIRKVLYMAALSAIRYNEPLKQFYKGLRKRGKAGKVALVAVMRKLLIILNTIAHRRTPWIPDYLPIKA